jgi:hypothetical protein
MLCFRLPNLLMFFILEVTRGLIRTGDTPALELLSCYSVIPLDIPEELRSIFYDAAEEEAFTHQSMLTTH